MMNIEKRAQAIKMILMDVDGTLTDGSLIVFNDGSELKSYHVRDGLGILLADLAEIKTGIITGKTSPALIKRAERLRIKELHQGILDKKKILFDIQKKHKLELKEIAYIGDDLSDIEVLKAVGLAGAVADAHPDVKKICQFICALPGGKGAVREFIEYILRAQDKWNLIEKKLEKIMLEKNQNG